MFIYSNVALTTTLQKQIAIPMVLGYSPLESRFSKMNHAAQIAVWMLTYACIVIRNCCYTITILESACESTLTKTAISHLEIVAQRRSCALLTRLKMLYTCRNTLHDQLPENPGRWCSEHISRNSKVCRDNFCIFLVIVRSLNIHLLSV